MSENVDYLIKALNNPIHENLSNINLSSIAKDKNDILQNLHLPPKTLKQYNKSLKQYRFIDELDDFKIGYYIRWINIKNPEILKLTNGGIILDIIIKNNTSYAILKNIYNKIMQINLNECIIFQKLSDQEKIILKAIDYISPIKN
jgi:hypothetical protein